MIASIIHLSELHGAATHLAVVAIPLYAAVLALRHLGAGRETLRHVEPWLLGGALVGVAAAGATGLLVWGQAQTTLRGRGFRVGTAHFWIGIALAGLLIAAALLHYCTTRRGPALRSLLLGTGVIAAAVVIAQGYLGGRMTYADGVGVDRGGELAQTAAGAAQLDVALATGAAPAEAGRAAFAARGLGCASCHGDLAQGGRGPELAGGADVGDFRRVHADGLFPASVVGDRDFQAIDAWLRTLRQTRGGRR
jgi:mono/diheme cytochrome c family protein